MCLDKSFLCIDTSGEIFRLIDNEVGIDFSGVGLRHQFAVDQLVNDRFNVDSRYADFPCQFRNAFRLVIGEYQKILPDAVIGKQRLRLIAAAAASAPIDVQISRISISRLSLAR